MSAKVWKSNGEKCPVTNIDKTGMGLWLATTLTGSRVGKEPKGRQAERLGPFGTRTGRRGRKETGRTASRTGFILLGTENGQQSNLA